MKKNLIKCNADSCFLCKNCLPEWKNAIVSHKSNFHVKKNEVIFKEGDPVKGIYFVLNGNVKVHKKWGSDKEIILRFANNGAIFGHRGMGESIYPVSATAIEEGIVCYFDMDFFESTLKVNHDFAYKLMMFFAKDLQESENKMRNLAHMSVKGRVAQALMLLETQFGLTYDGFINVKLSRQDLASFTGATYETVFRVINELTNEHIISLQNKNIKVTDKQRLRQLTNDEAL
ncbi:Crp/Fnr family transcriptional regulator [Mucilaginibacter sp. OK098]|uniref:Crp/Fnr family transcriptional regulator n=1 Tax=Mucilaginibacter sp. OK098 TaxID=1855297 RepID=UPI00091B34D9|nr:Crp/Fnr family transcriptional regulator [Mucilaginibacter sp. OK098]SHL90128.1 cAMP-binding domain of CRP or a regulatory subunit of cAMP-dependent protein kinases [Mucilaginibacter sp. OK098]